MATPDWMQTLPDHEGQPDAVVAARNAYRAKKTALVVRIKLTSISQDTYAANVAFTDDQCSAVLADIIALGWDLNSTNLCNRSWSLVAVFTHGRRAGTEYL